MEIAEKLRPFQSRHGKVIDTILSDVNVGDSVHQSLISSFLISIASVKKEIQEFERLLNKKIDISKKTEEHWQEFWENGIKRIRAIQ